MRPPQMAAQPQVVPDWLPGLWRPPGRHWWDDPGCRAGSVWCSVHGLRRGAPTIVLGAKISATSPATWSLGMATGTPLSIPRQPMSWLPRPASLPLHQVRTWGCGCALRSDPWPAHTDDRDSGERRGPAGAASRLEGSDTPVHAVH